MTMPQARPALFIVALLTLLPATLLLALASFFSIGSVISFIQQPSSDIFWRLAGYDSVD